MFYILSYNALERWEEGKGIGSEIGTGSSR